MICRLCLSDLNLNSSVMLFNEFDSDDGPPLLTIIAKHLHLHITWDDEVSTAICNECNKHLSEFENYCVFIKEQQIKLSQKVPVGHENVNSMNQHEYEPNEDNVTQEMKVQCEPDEDFLTEGIHFQCVSDEDITTKKTEMQEGTNKDIVTNRIQVQFEPHKDIITQENKVQCDTEQGGFTIDMQLPRISIPCDSDEDVVAEDIVNPQCESDKDSVAEIDLTSSSSYPDEGVAKDIEHLQCESDKVIDEIDLTSSSSYSKPLSTSSFCQAYATFIGTSREVTSKSSVCYECVEPIPDATTIKQLQPIQELYQRHLLEYRMSSIDQIIIARCVIDACFKNAPERKLGNEDLLKLAENIVEVFPSELVTTYYIPSLLYNNAKGKLWSAYNNKRKKALRATKQERPKCAPVKDIVIKNALQLKCVPDEDIATKTRKVQFETQQDIVTKEIQVQIEPDKDTVTKKIQLQCVPEEDIFSKELEVQYETNEDIVTKEVGLQCVPNENSFTINELQIKFEPEEAVITEMDINLLQNSHICSLNSSYSEPSSSSMFHQADIEFIESSSSSYSFDSDKTVESIPDATSIKLIQPIQKLYQNYLLGVPICSIDRFIIARSVIEACLKNAPEKILVSEDFVRLAENITEVFPSELVTTYYTPSFPNKQAEGKLYNAYVAQRQQALSVEGFIKNRSSKCLSSETDKTQNHEAFLTQDVTEQRLSRKRRLRDGSNPLELSEELFHQNFKINKSMFRYLLEELDQALPKRNKYAITTLTKLSSCLRYFAQGSYQNVEEKDDHVGLSKSMFSEALSEVLHAFESRLCPKWIISKMSPEEKRNVNLTFYNRCKIPGVVGCIDGTHIKIISPPKNSHLYCQGNYYHSLNVLLVCDDQMRIRYIDAHPGACHDSVTWRVSALRSSMEHEYLNGEKNSWLLGDASFPLEPWLLTPHTLFQDNSPESRFNKAHQHGLSIIKRVNSVLKRKFRCLFSSSGLHYPPEKSIQLINVCIALHNIGIFYKVQNDSDISADIVLIDDDDDDDDESNEVIDEVISTSDSAYKEAAQQIRSVIGNSLFKSYVS